MPTTVSAWQRPKKMQDAGEQTKTGCRHLDAAEHKEEKRRDGKKKKEKRPLVDGEVEGAV